MYYNYRYRLYPTKEQIGIMDHHLDIHRWTYNHFLEVINRDGQLPYDILSSDLPYLKAELQEDRFGNLYDLKDVHAQSLAYTLRQLYSNIMRVSGTKKKNKKNEEKGEYKRVRKTGKLRFKSKDRFKSFTYIQQGFEILYDCNLIEKNNHPKLYLPKRLQILRLSKIGDIPIRIHRDISKGYMIKKITIKKYPSGEWYAILSIHPEIEKKTKDERIKEIRYKAKDDKDVNKYRKNIETLKNILEKKDLKALKIIGIDLGIINYLYDSNRNSESHPKNIEKFQKRLKKEQQKFAKKELKEEEVIDKGGNKYLRKRSSKNRDKQKEKIGKIHKKIKDRRDDFDHKISIKYVNNNDILIFEDLNIYGIIQMSRNARNIIDASWGKFIRMSEYKAESAGKLVIKVDPRDTSQRCSKCRKITFKSLYIRTHKCPYCGLELDRDYNSSLEIKRLGIIEINKMICELNKRVGRPLPEFKPLEI